MRSRYRLHGRVHSERSDYFRSINDAKPPRENPRRVNQRPRLNDQKRRKWSGPRSVNITRRHSRQRNSELAVLYVLDLSFMDMYVCLQARLSSKGLDRAGIYQGPVSCACIRPVFVSLGSSSVDVLPSYCHLSAGGNLSRSKKKYSVNSMNMRDIILREEFARLPAYVVEPLK